jgi:hypothetical protein
MNANSDNEYIDNKVGDVRTAVDDVGTAVDDLRLTMNERFDVVNVKLDVHRKEVLAFIDSAIAKGTGEVVKWVVGLFVTTIALNVALASVVLHVALREPPPAAPITPPPPAPLQSISTPAVIIQLTPQGATVLPAAPPAAKP